MNLQELQNLTLDIKREYVDLNNRESRTPWDAAAYADGLLIDVAGLVRMLMIRDGLREGEQTPERIAHELADIVWSAFAIADELDIDLASELPEQLQWLRSRFD